jgi:hypothetical protein
MNKKILYLFLALLLPGLVFVFLKYFGNNEFEVPVYYKDGVGALGRDCQQQYPAPYVIPAQSLIEFSGPTVIAFVADKSREAYSEYDFQLRRVANEFDSHAVRILIADTITLIENKNNERRVSLNRKSYRNEKECIYLVGEEYATVLVDESRQIRGYYEDNQKDTERLMVELKILLKQY